MHRPPTINPPTASNQYTISPASRTDVEQSIVNTHLVNAYMNEGILWTIFRGCLWLEDDSIRKCSVPEGPSSNKSFYLSCIVCVPFLHMQSLTESSTILGGVHCYGFYAMDEKTEMDRSLRTVWSPHSLVNGIDGTQSSPSFGPTHPPPLNVGESGML